ncbi:MAG: bifunctional 4-hydroxy-2-oxoglutarate aldolase/2-dehydro-3-deoxy-phosphogluconate aldolase [Kiritimatiellae bacterium]|nr:bifunctional 4-hydroxy-2-oxoglutarate aldolase/2-dehydro-3-deoxy-phosphogluconate aldolase [Kiritimatiellia bacterium]
MTKQEQLSLITESGLIVIMRADKPRGLLEAGRALVKGGIRALEVTVTTPKALELIRQLADELREKALVGVGSVLDAETARAAILSGAEFLVCPIINQEVIAMANRYGKVVIPGAFTPTEIVAAQTAGADLIKVFPAEVLGPQYVKAVKAPLPQVQLVPTGGITLENIGAYLKAGATALGVGGSLVNRKMLAEGRFNALTALAERFTAAVKEARK